MTSAPQGYHRRRIRYIDEAVQKWLLVGLVLLEVGLVAAFSWLMYRQLNRIVEENLYRVHLGGAAPLLDQLLHAALPLLAMFLLANALALVVAYLIWRRYLNAVLSEFLKLVGKTDRLDFSRDANPAPHRHELLLLTDAQRAKERERLAAIRENLSMLEAELSESVDAEKIRRALNGLDALLPSENRPV